jgi:hypothetical protein
MKLSVRRSIVVFGLFAATGVVCPVGARTIDVSSYDAGVFAEHGQYLIDSADVSAKSRYADPARSRIQVRGALTELYRKGRRLALEELQVPDSTSPPADRFAVDLVKQDDFRAMLGVGVILVALQLRRKHRSLKQSLIAG